MDPLTYSSQTVVLTGASSGLGVEFARRLAQRGCRLVLVARREQRLRELAHNIDRVHGTQPIVIPMDLARDDAGTALREALDEQGVQATSLINNAGFAVWEHLATSDPEALRREIALNVGAVVDITRALMDQLLAQPGGFVVNLASVAAYQPMPRMAVYGATKAFVLSFSEALREEVRGSGLRVMAVSPGPTQTEFFEVAGSGASGGMPMMSAEQVVAATLKALERKSPPPSIVPGTANRVATTAGRFLPRRAVARASALVMDRAAQS